MCHTPGFYTGVGSLNLGPHSFLVSIIQMCCLLLLLLYCKAPSSRAEPATRVSCHGRNRELNLGNKREEADQGRQEKRDASRKVHLLLLGAS